MGDGPQKDWKYLTIWEFHVRDGMEKQFEEAYGAEGSWVQLFRQNDGYVSTELSRDAKDLQRYVTLDFWISREAYERFQDTRKVEYAAIDRECEPLTESETEIGGFERIIRFSGR
jgi:heme-degrading monooxygenase HmoA